MTPKEKYEELKHDFFEKKTPAERETFLIMINALYGDQISEEQLDNLKKHIELTERQGEQHGKA